MPTRTKKHVVRKIVLRLPDLDHAKTSVLNSLSSPRSRRNYKFAMEQFITWYCSEPIKLVEDPAKNFLVIMKDGKIYKDTVSEGSRR